MNTKHCFKQTAALLALFLAGLCAAPLAWAQSGERKEGRVFIKIFTFAETVNTVAGPVAVDKANAGTVIDNALRSYAISGNSGTLLYRAVQTGLSAIEEDSSDFPDDVTSISLLTFTDGLDQGSTVPSLPPIGKDGITFAGKGSEESRQILRRQFDNLQTDGVVLNNGRRIPVDVYSIGLMGDDVADERAFQQSLQDIATRQEMGIKADNLEMVKTEFDRIAKDLSTKSNETTLSIPGPASGTKVRWTFDVPSAKKTSDPSYNLPAAAIGSRRYIEGDFSYDNYNTPVMRNITYSGVSSRFKEGAEIQGTQNSKNPTMLDFIFPELESGSTGNDEVRQWIMEPGRNWQANIETDTAIEDITTQSTAVIYIALDQSKSMSQEGINQVSQAVKDFIGVFVPEYTVQPVRTAQPQPRSQPQPQPSAPSENPYMYLYLDLAPAFVGLFADGFGIGFGFEVGRGAFSFGTYMDLVGGSSFFALDGLLKFRWYPLDSAVKGWYMGTILGLGMLIEEYTEEYTYGYYSSYTSTRTRTDTNLVFTIGVETGYKFVFGDFGLEPSIGYTFGEYGGVKFGVNMGILFY
jgi:hypothetical protein